MVRKLVFLVMLVLASAAGATSGSRIDDGSPPDRYQWLDSTANVRLTTQSVINDICGTAPEGFQTLACELPSGNIILPDPCGSSYLGDPYAHIFCHELGHLHGWPGTHPRP